MYKYFLWLLKIGIITNVFFLWNTFIMPLKSIDTHLLFPAQILFLVSGYRCLFPVNYTTSAVLHDSFFSSIFFTRFLATFAEVGYIYLFSHLIRLLNAEQIQMIDFISWLMVLQVIISQFFVWGAIVINREKFYFYEELGWAIIFFINTILSFILLLNINFIPNHKVLLQTNIIFGVIYLPWQWFHLKMINNRLKKKIKVSDQFKFTSQKFINGIIMSVKLKNKTSSPDNWGGIIGMTWMFCYWVALIPFWLYFIINTY